MKNIKSLYPLIIAVVGALMLIITFFLPFASAKGDYREALLKNPDEVFLQEADMKSGDAVDISLLEFIKIDAAAGTSQGATLVNMIVIIVYGVFAVLTLLFSILRKPIAIIIFDIIAQDSSFKLLNFYIKKINKAVNLKRYFIFINIKVYILIVH